MRLVEDTLCLPTGTPLFCASNRNDSFACLPQAHVLVIIGGGLLTIVACVMLFMYDTGLVRRSILQDAGKHIVVKNFLAHN